MFWALYKVYYKVYIPTPVYSKLKTKQKTKKIKIVIKQLKPCRNPPDFLGNLTVWKVLLSIQQAK